MPQANVEPLTYLELYSRRKASVNISWRHPPAHLWYRSEGPGATIHFKGDRKDQTALARLTSRHLKTLRFSREDIDASNLQSLLKNDKVSDMGVKEFISIDDDILTKVPIHNVTDLIQRHTNNDSNDDDECNINENISDKEQLHH
ncbi:hypothetical protein AVEN_265634-1 [Araneus ventricosus]|uniref:Uncharacterized protein n=1 Tax=Araneus ventricosus TaxID=182803 RepID=A0A4Y2GFJ1_ARAVE|nr:hypothetical protein AVEN_265634-1 [Araneus ventricosus]